MIKDDQKRKTYSYTVLHTNAATAAACKAVMSQKQGDIIHSTVEDYTYFSLFLELFSLIEITLLCHRSNLIKNVPLINDFLKKREIFRVEIVKNCEISHLNI